MKKHKASLRISMIALFLLVFIATYLFICFGIPGMRIKLEAEPLEYFFESITHMAFVKTTISFAAAIVAETVLFIIRRKR